MSNPIVNKPRRFNRVAVAVLLLAMVLLVASVGRLFLPCLYALEGVPIASLSDLTLLTSFTDGWKAGQVEEGHARLRPGAQAAPA